MWTMNFLMFKPDLEKAEEPDIKFPTSVQFSRSVMSDSLRPHESQHARPPCPSPTPGVHQTHVHRVSDAINHLILCRPLLLLPPIPPSIRVLSNESTVCMRWPKYWSFSFSIIPSTEIPGLISFRMDWLDLLAVQGTLKSLPRSVEKLSSMKTVPGAKKVGEPLSQIQKRLEILLG